MILSLPINKYWLVTRYYNKGVICDLVTAKECEELRKQVDGIEHQGYNVYYDGYKEYGEAAAAQLQTYIDYDINTLLDYAENIDKSVQFADVSISKKQAMRYEYFGKSFNGTEESYILRVYHTGHFKGEVCMMTYGPKGGTNALNDHDNKDLLMYGLTTAVFIVTGKKNMEEVFI